MSGPRPTPKPPLGVRPPLVAKLSDRLTDTQLAALARVRGAAKEPPATTPYAGAVEMHLDRTALAAVAEAARHLAAAVDDLLKTETTT